MEQVVWVDSHYIAAPRCPPSSPGIASSTWPPTWPWSMGWPTSSPPASPPPCSGWWRPWQELPEDGVGESRPPGLGNRPIVGCLLQAPPGWPSPGRCGSWVVEAPSPTYGQSSGRGGEWRTCRRTATTQMSSMMFTNKQCDWELSSCTTDKYKRYITFWWIFLNFQLVRNLLGDLAEIWPPKVLFSVEKLYFRQIIWAALHLQGVSSYLTRVRGWL